MRSLVGLGRGGQRRAQPRAPGKEGTGRPGSPRIEVSTKLTLPITGTDFCPFGSEIWVTAARTGRTFQLGWRAIAVTRDLARPTYVLAKYQTDRAGVGLSRARHPAVESKPSGVMQIDGGHLVDPRGKTPFPTLPSTTEGPAVSTGSIGITSFPSCRLPADCRQMRSVCPILQTRCPGTARGKWVKNGPAAGFGLSLLDRASGPESP